ncbi:helix-turn-helix domain-containing protein [Streptomyces sp. NBC_01336]|uniref:GlxA family transcriptional regulator n=1 Tax=Streptomyces sp. NBC_01336 TaxID=2903829 RepID=UPI002E15B23D|nr:helix-turn-helix domain-containing protein [Streptomyces sp. NBC_01336]
MALVVLPNLVPLGLAVPMDVFGPKPDLDRPLPNWDLAPYETYLVGAAGPSGTLGDWMAMRDVRPPESLSEADTVIVPGMGDPMAAVDPELLAQIGAAGRRGARMVSICTGAFALAQAGVLAGRRATTHWMFSRLLQERYPDVRVIDHHLYIDDGQVLTSGGVMSGMDLCMHILRRDLGSERANRTARILVFPPHRDGGQSQFVMHAWPSDTRGLGNTLDWMRENLDRTLTLDDVAAHAHMSVRSLSRKFREVTGSTVVTWLSEQRIERAKQMLETSDLTVGRIAERVGFGTHEAFRLQFARQVGATPTAYRATFRTGFQTAAPPR